MILRRHPDPAAVRALRERHGWTLEQMADATWATPLEVAAWEAGTVRVPPAQAVRLRELAAVDRLRRSAPSPSPRWMLSCAWADEHVPGLHELLWYEPREAESNPQVRAHLEGCPVCREVREEGRAQRALAPASAPEPERSVGHLGYGVDAIPREFHLLHAGIKETGPFLLLMLMLVMQDRFFPGMPSPGELWVESLAGLLALSLTHRFTKRPLRNHPYVGGLLAGVVGAGVGMVTWTLRHPDADPFSVPVLAVCAFLAVVLGLVDGLRRDAEGVADPRGEPAVAPSASPVLTEGPLRDDVSRGWARAEHSPAAEQGR
ncbi:helix-turn-helix transcriptional regulator [Longimicrobium sp.]|uniref:helix-turn-helix domain-containing protein n=1 Tax=Longimicrobium sp. TaxID=2029185 RepID=UPI002E3683BD|nr:helix-turn-helix transcriptional regulator [Longimicrobium sp.]HEX6040722.1 helix-turn-helix transcriptional regulator [Longimicrobium sp.]